MNWKKIAIILGWISAAGISYFAFDTLTSLGDLLHAITTQPLIFILALVVTVPAVIAVWFGIIFIEQASSTAQVIRRFILLSLGSWVWLYLGTLALALIRLQ